MSLQESKRKIFRKFGREFVREGYDVEKDISIKFEKICDYIGEAKSNTVRKLIINFVKSFEKREDSSNPKLTVGSGIDSDPTDIFKEAVLQAQNMVFPNIKKDIDNLRRDIKSQQSLMNSILDYIKTKELKNIHSDFHPLENPKK